MVNDDGRDSLHLEVKIAEDRRVKPVIQAITAAVPYAHYFDPCASSVNAIPPSMTKRTIVGRRNHA
jgi:hypothetical protein